MFHLVYKESDYPCETAPQNVENYKPFEIELKMENIDYLVLFGIGINLKINGFGFKVNEIVSLKINFSDLTGTKKKNER